MKKNNLTLYDLFYIFIFGCILGWLVEGLWTLLKKHLLINHSAVVLGPFNFIYGFGAVILTVLLYNFKKTSNFKIFITSFIGGTILEYLTSYSMETLLGFIPWNYSAKFMNINGRVSLFYSIFWGILGLIWIKYIYPKLKKVIDKSNHNVGKKVAIFMVIFLILDLMLSFVAVCRGKDFEKGISPQNKFEEFLDDNFSTTYLNNMYNNRWNKKR